MTNHVRMIPMLGACLLSFVSCSGKEPGSDAVATVNGHEITTAELNHELAQQGVFNAENPTVAKAALEAIVNRKLLADLARERELDRTPDIILAEQRLQEQLLANAAIGFLAPAGRAPDQKEVAKFVANLEQTGRARTIFQIQGLRFAVRTDQTIIKSLEQAKSMEAVAEVLEKAKVPTQTSNLTWDSAAMPSELVRQLDALPEGGPFVIAQPDGALAGVILQKQRQPLTAEQARELGNAAVGQQAVTRAVSEWLQGARTSAEINYRDGYGPELRPTATGAAQPGA